MAINREWHAMHKLDRKATFEERLNWHLKHAANCDCREMPPAIKRELEARGLWVPAPVVRVRGPEPPPPESDHS